MSGSKEFKKQFTGTGKDDKIFIESKTSYARILFLDPQDRKVSGVLFFISFLATPLKSLVGITKDKHSFRFNLLRFAHTSRLCLIGMEDSRTGQPTPTPWPPHRLGIKIKDSLMHSFKYGVAFGWGMS